MGAPALTPPLQHALDIVEQLPVEDQISLIEIIQQRLTEQRRAEIARDARAHYGTVPNSDSGVAMDLAGLIADIHALEKELLDLEHKYGLLQRIQRNAPSLKGLVRVAA